MEKEVQIELGINWDEAPHALVEIAQVKVPKEMFASKDEESVMMLARQMSITIIRELERAMYDDALMGKVAKLLCQHTELKHVKNTVTIEEFLEESKHV